MGQFDFYGRMAKADLPDTRQNGRYGVQSDAEILIPQDVITKLKLAAEDRFLDVGCGMGLNLFAAHDIVAEATGCDHPDIIAKLKTKPEAKDITFFDGNFLAQDFERSYTKTLIYSVLHTLTDKDTLLRFIDKALLVTEKPGMVLLGDIPNKDKKERFLSSARGAAFQKDWEALCANAPEEVDLSIFQEEEDKNTVNFDDALVTEVIKHIRNQGWHAYLVDQPQDLPFGNTREDILIIGPEHQD